MPPAPPFKGQVVMNYESMASHVENDNNRRFDILTGKGREYTDGDDALSNFKLNATRLGMNPPQVLAIYMMKHINSIETYLKQFTSGSLDDIVDSSEGITSRIDDAINYLELLHLLLIDLGFVDVAKTDKV